MISTELQKWFIVMFTTVEMAASQYPMPYLQQYPMYHPIPVAPPPPMPVPVPVPVPIPVGIVIPEASNAAAAQTTTTTTTTEKPQQQFLKIYLPWVPFNWQMPDFMPPNLTIPLPDCNLTFKLPPQMPPPMPMPFVMPPPPPVIMIPLPPNMVDTIPKDRSSFSRSSSSSSSSTSDESDSSDSESSDEGSKRKSKYDIYRRSRRLMSFDRSEIQPVLSYVSDNGDVKFRKRLNRRDAAELLQTATKSARNVQIMAGDDSSDRSRVLVVASPAKKNIETKRSMQQIGNGNKEIVFMPPNNKKISNLTVSFQVVR